LNYHTNFYHHITAILKEQPNCLKFYKCALLLHCWEFYQVCLTGALLGVLSSVYYCYTVDIHQTIGLLALQCKSKLSAKARRSNECEGGQGCACG
jgi:hypothetical protein